MSHLWLFLSLCDMACLFACRYASPYFFGHDGVRSYRGGQAKQYGMLIGITQPSVAGLTSEEAMRRDQLFLFWKHARVQHAREGTIGASWLELFARFQAIGGQLPCLLLQSSQHVSFKAMLDNFMLKSKAMFALQGSDDVAELLKPCRTPGARLLQYGVSCHLPLHALSSASTLRLQS